jgi:N6-adenosine-specific RNA methylase IME4
MADPKHTTDTDLVVVKLNTARLALSQAKTIQDAKQVIDIAGAMEVYAKRQQLGQDAIDYAHAIKIEALRRVGELLQASDRNEGRPGPGRGKAGTPAAPALSSAPPTLADLGIDKKLSSLAQKLADLPEIQFAQVAEGVTSVAAAIREVKKEQAKAVVLPTTTRYRVIYADPPWRYADKCDAGSVQSGGAETHYPSMSVTELCALPVTAMAEDDAVLFLWTTSPLLFECAPVIEAWDFAYKASFVWDKVRHNMGHYNSVRHELLLIATRGKCQPDVPKLFDSVVTEERTRHSVKPESFRTIIDTIYPTGRRIELFRRGPTVKGWDAWGNEAV